MTTSASLRSWLKKLPRITRTYPRRPNSAIHICVQAYRKPMRWAQLTLAENDPGNFDLDFWLDYFHCVHADGVCLSAGGYVAYYPTNIPLHHRSAWLGDVDPFGDLVAGRRAMDMVVLACTDPHAIHVDAITAHPEWIAVDADGNPTRH